MSEMLHKAPAQTVLTPYVGEGYERGSIVYNAWGYDQTNIDFFVIAKRTSSGFVELLPMSSVETHDSASMAGHCTPDKVEPDAKPLRRKVKSRDGKEIGLQIKGYGWCQLWDGTPKRYSTYG